MTATAIPSLQTLPASASRAASDAPEWLQATYDKASDCFIINTPDDTASKFWIGGAGQHGKVRLESMLSWGLISLGQSCSSNCKGTLTHVEQPVHENDM